MIFFNHSTSLECYLFTNLAITHLVPPALFLLSDNRLQSSVSMCPILIPASLQISITLSSGLQHSNFSSKAVGKIITEVDAKKYYLPWQFFANVIKQISVLALAIPSAVFGSYFGNVVLFN